MDKTPNDELLGLLVCKHCQHAYIRMSVYRAFEGYSCKCPKCNGSDFGVALYNEAK